MANSNLKYNGTDLDTLLVPRSAVWQPGERVNLFVFGGDSNNYGELGLNNSSYNINSPTLVGSITNWKQVESCEDYSIAVKKDGTLWSWGNNQFYGQLGLNDRTNRSGPVQVGLLTDWSSVNGTAYGSSIAIKTNGTLWSWGNNGSGALGLGDSIHRSSPVQVGSLTNWKLVQCGWYHVAAIKTDGTLWTWGSNTWGQLGHNNQTTYSSPTQVGSLTNWSLISCGRYHTMAIKTDGTLWAWGGNDFTFSYYPQRGMLGLNDIVHRSSPVQVGSLTNWRNVTAHMFNTVATKTDGTIWTWGYDSGLLGFGNASGSTAVSSPTQLGTLTNWSSIYGKGSRHVLAIKQDGSLHSWGYNFDGQCGVYTFNGSTVSSPVQVGALTNWIDASASKNHSFAISTY